MGLFVSKTVSRSNFDINSGNSLVIVGLGNIGKEFTDTRHNIGFECVDSLQKAQSEFSNWQVKKSLWCELSQGTFGQTKVLLIKPTTLMNNSGKAVKAVCDYYKLPSNKITIVHDELDIPFGQIRTRFDGGSAGNNGIKSIIEHLSNEFGRVRIGIGGEKGHLDSSSYVLTKFNPAESKELTKLKREVQSILIELIYRGELYPETRSFIL
jgi:PTH1 family peptidyl-tRNA hydrolase